MSDHELSTGEEQPAGLPPSIERASKLLYWLAGVGALWALTASIFIFVDLDQTVRDAIAEDPTLEESSVRTAGQIFGGLFIVGAAAIVAALVPLARSIREPGSRTARTLTVVTLSVGILLELLLLLSTRGLVGLVLLVAALVLSIIVLVALLSAESARHFTTKQT